MEKLKAVIPPELMPLMMEVMQASDPTKHLPADAGKDLFKLMHAKADDILEHFNTKFEMKSSDVLIASYPKTGTNWTIEIIDRLIYQDAETFGKWKALPLPLRELEMGTAKKFEIFDKLLFKRRVFGTHATADRLDIERIKNKKVKVVYVVRNPKDTLVSMFNFLKKLPPFQKEPMSALVSNGFSVFYQHYMNGEIPIDGSTKGYLHAIKTWHKIREELGIYFIYYEDLKKDFRGEVTKLAKFLEVDLSEEKLSEISDKCTIDSMKKSYVERAGFQGKHATAFINKGGVGGWKNYFTVAQSEQWDALVKEEMSGTDVSFQYTI